MIIFKYEIPLETSFTLNLPVDCKILSFQVQRNVPCLWALVDPEKEPTTRHFKIIGTGHDFDYDRYKMTYIGTIQMADGDLVWHLFEDLT